MTGAGLAVLNEISAGANGIIGGCLALIPVFVVAAVGLLLICEVAGRLERKLCRRETRRRMRTLVGGPSAGRQAA